MFLSERSSGACSVDILGLLGKHINQEAISNVIDVTHVNAGIYCVHPQTTLLLLLESPISIDVSSCFCLRSLTLLLVMPSV